MSQKKIFDDDLGKKRISKVTLKLHKRAYVEMRTLHVQVPFSLHYKSIH